MGGILYVGADDSNHGGKTKGEFIVATFSLIHDDSIRNLFPNTRDNLLVDKWLEDGGDYRFTICTGEKYRSSQNLPIVVPVLIDSYLSQVDLDIETVKVYLDGMLKSTFKKEMREELLDISGIEKVVIGNFTKKRVVVSNSVKKRKGKIKGKSRVIKRHDCPRLVWIADTLANRLYNYSGPVSNLLSHKKMVYSSKL